MRDHQLIILLTRDSFENLRKCEPSDVPEYASFLDVLASGEWTKKSTNVLEELRFWQSEDNGKEMMSYKIKEESYAIWEVATSFDLLGYTGAYPLVDYDKSTFYKQHAILHQVGTFPGLPEKHMNIDNVEYNVAERPKDIAQILEPSTPEEEILYNMELYILSKGLVLDVLKNKQAGLPIHLTEKQAFVLNLKGPILMSGEAGSGKTTVITHWLLNNLAKGVEKQLFVTFSERLVEVTEAELEEMLPEKVRAKGHGIKYMTYRDLLLGIAETGEIESKFDPDKEMTFDYFCREYAEHIKRNLDPFLVWDEIRSVIKGSSLKKGRTLIGYDFYWDLNEERGQCKTPEHLRKPYYDEACHYQSYLEQSGMWDAIDLARECLEKVQYAEKFDRIACDEVQDLAPVEIILLVHLTTDYDVSNIFFTGDMAQVINPSGFRWSALKGLLSDVYGRRDIMDVWSLKRNFRSTSQIVDLANHAFNIREEMLGKSPERVHQGSSVTGPKPRYLKESPLSLLKDCENVRSDLRMILVKNERQKKDLVEKLGEAQYRAPVLTVEESKGLERDGVLLWDFFEPRTDISKDHWRNVFIPKRREAFRDLIEQEKELPYGLEYEFNLLHVGLTRARNHLFIYEEKKDTGLLGLNGVEKLVEMISEVNEQTFSHIWGTEPAKASTLETTGSELWSTNRKLSIEYYKEAALGYLEEKRLEDAARCFKRAGEYDKAASCHEKIGDEISRHECMALHHKSTSQWKLSADHWIQRAKLLEEAKDWDKAYLSYDRAKEMFRKANLTVDQAEATRAKARCALASGKEDFVFRGLEALDNTISLLRAKETEKCLNTTNYAIEMGEKISKKKYEGLVKGVRIEEWIPSLYIKRGELEAILDRPKAAAESAMTASRLWKSLERPEDYLKQWIGSLQKAADWYGQASDFETAIEVRRQIVDLSRGYSKPPEVLEYWRELIEELRNYNLADESMTEVESFTKYFMEKTLSDVAIEELETHENWCIKRGLRDSQIETLNLMATIHSKSDRLYRSAQTRTRAAEISEEMGELQDAANLHDEAGTDFLDSDMVEKAVGSFSRTKDCLEKYRSSLMAGTYSLDTVIIEKLLPNGYQDFAVKWIEVCAKAFSTDLSAAIRQVNKSINGLKGRIASFKERRDKEKDFSKRSNIDDQIRTHRSTIGWNSLTIGVAHNFAIEMGASSSRLLKERANYFNAAIDMFTETDNLKMIEIAEKYKDSLGDDDSEEN